MIHVLKRLPRLPCGEEGVGRQVWVQEDRLPSQGESSPQSPVTAGLSSREEMMPGV